MSNWELRNARQVACYDLFNLYKELDPFEWEQTFFQGVLETYEKLRQGKWREVVADLRKDLKSIDPESPEYSDMLAIIDGIEEDETTAEEDGIEP